MAALAFLVSPVFLAAAPAYSGIALKTEPCPSCRAASPVAGTDERYGEVRRVPAATAGRSPVSERLPRPYLFPYRKLTVTSEDLFNRRRGGAKSFSFFVFSQVEAPRLRFRVIDEKGSLLGFKVLVNGRVAGVLDGDGFGTGPARGGFTGDFGDWVSFGRLGRRGLNQFYLLPLYALDGARSRSRRFVDWCAEIYIQKGMKVEPALIFKGLRDMEAVEEAVYFHLRRFDELLRSLPACCFPRPFIADARRLPRDVRAAWRRSRSREFLKMMDRFYWSAYGRRLDVGGLFEAMLSRLDGIRWIWNEPGVHPLAAYIYATNGERAFLHPYLGDVLLAKRACKNAYLAFCDDGRVLDERKLDSMLRALREEKRRLSDLVAAIRPVEQACRRRADRMYAKFPYWRGLFRKAFKARVRARIWPSALYPRREDLFRERMLLDEYFRLVRDFARADYQLAVFRCDLLEAFFEHPRRPVVVPGLKPFHPQDNP